MSEENVEIVRRAILGWNDRGHESLIERLHPEVEFHPPRDSMNPGPFSAPTAFGSTSRGLTRSSRISESSRSR